MELTTWMKPKNSKTFAACIFFLFTRRFLFGYRTPLLILFQSIQTQKNVIVRHPGRIESQFAQLRRVTVHRPEQNRPYTTRNCKRQNLHAQRRRRFSLPHRHRQHLLIFVPVLAPEIRVHETHKCFSHSTSFWIECPFPLHGVCFDFKLLFCYLASKKRCRIPDLGVDSESPGPLVLDVFSTQYPFFSPSRFRGFPLLPLNVLW